MQEKYLVTPALPYANGPIHLGHLVEHVQVNIFVRALRMAKKDVLYVCGADSHGTPIEMSAIKAGISPVDFAKQWQKKQDASFKRYDIEFDGGYGSTHTEVNKKHAEQIFKSLKDKGFIQQKEIEQLFDPELKRFLPDRMVKGTCPFCKAQDQYGDNCESCGHTYQPTDLIDAKSALSGATPILKKSRHYFVSLSSLAKQLKDWTAADNTVHPDIQASLERWFQEGLKDWDISRDGPYFGFPIPGEDDKYFYVWLDAPVGYISLSEKAAQLTGKSFKDYWLDKDTKIIHFIGKDIVYFHTLFWPAMLMAADYNLPSQIVVHGMLTVNGEKMSKSRGTFILADTFSKHFDPETLRYYFACKLGSRAEDIDLNLGDFIQRVNTDLINKVINLVSRALPLLGRLFEYHAGELDNDAAELISKAQRSVGEVQNLYLHYEYQKALNEIVRLAEDANKYLQDSAPWKIAGQDPKKSQSILTTGLYIGKICLGLLKPVIPQAVSKLENIINDGQEFYFDTLALPFQKDQKLKAYEHIFKRIDESQLKALKDETMNTAQPNEPQELTEKTSPLISIDKFMDVELRAAKVMHAQAVEGSDKLIECKLNLGKFGERTVFSGLRPHVEPADMVGKTVVLVFNLQPRKMRFGTSEGMILAAGEKVPEPIFLHNTEAGERIR
ncbi:MAG: methionine--tRNA ligase [Myxococcales bacterium]|nr:methionine--tRNA ligase [Myxococcales bacterium]USN50879.1 MAG: methionine--tRNA ligase [Myxococcales bacterium]